MAKRKRKRLTPEEWADERRRAEEILTKLRERIDHHTAILKEKYGPEYRTAKTYEEWLELRDKYARIDREREGLRFRWFRALRPSPPA